MPKNYDFSDDPQVRGTPSFGAPILGVMLAAMFVIALWLYRRDATSVQSVEAPFTPVCRINFGQGVHAFQCGGEVFGFEFTRYLELHPGTRVTPLGTEVYTDSSQTHWLMLTHSDGTPVSIGNPLKRPPP